LVTEDEDHCEQFVEIFQDGGASWAAGTALDALQRHASGEQTLKRIEIHPDVEAPALLSG
jgi:hypothetical protein